MRKTILLALLALLCLALPACAMDEVIEQLDVSAKINANASVTITEDIRFYAGGIDIVRGLIRDIPIDYSSGSSVKRSEFQLDSALMDGQTTPVEISKNGPAMTLRIGDPGEKLSIGPHTISITYTIAGMVGLFEKYDELYWNASGTGWEIPVLKCRFRAKLPGQLFGQGFSGIEWYAGTKGSKGDPYLARKLPDNSVVTTGALPPGHGLTVVYVWPKGLITPPPPTLSERLAGMQYILIPILMGALYLALWWRFGRDKPLGTVIPIFYPPEGIDPALLRAVRNFSFDNVSFAANIIDLGVKKYINISADGDDFTLKRTAKKALNDITPGQSHLMDTLFQDGKRIKMDDHNSRAISARTVAENATKARSDEFFSDHLKYWLVGVIPVLLFPLFDMAAGLDWALSPLLPVAIVICSYLMYATIRSKTGSFSRILIGTVLGIAVCIIMAVLSAMVYIDQDEALILPAIITAVSSVAIAALFRYLMYSYTAKGLDLLRSAEGLIMYMTVAEKSRLETLAPPEETPQLFERLLPWAYALGVARTWADRFEDVLAKQNYTPSWYQGDMGYFFYGSGLGHFTSQMHSASVPAIDPTSSSGFGGSGSVGGGGGGGGGRGW